MPQENGELYRRAAQAYNDDDLDAFLALMDPDVDAIPRVAPMEGGYRGHDGMRRFWGNLHDTFPDFHTVVVEVRELGHLTLAELRNRGRGVGSDIPVEQRSWHVAKWRDQRIIRWRAYGTAAEALEAFERGD
jgi:ketosteroid isomerase-like protein